MSDSARDKHTDGEQDTGVRSATMPPLKEIPAELLAPKKASLRIGSDTCRIAIELTPFVIDGEEVNETLEFDLGLECDQASELAGKTFTFPSNPEDGYVEGSIYIWSSHNPIDLHSINFGKARKGQIDATIEMTFVFEFEGNAKNVRKSFALKLAINPE